MEKLNIFLTPPSRYWKYGFSLTFSVKLFMDFHLMWNFSTFRQFLTFDRSPKFDKPTDRLTVTAVES